MATLKYKSGDSWIDILHPIGSFYFSNSDESPSVLFGGTWTQIMGAAIRGDSSTGYTGNDTCTLTVDEIPAHRHGIQQTYNVGSGVGSTVPAWNSNYFNTQYTDYSGGGGSTFNRAALLQLLYLVQNSITSPLLGVKLYVLD